MTSVDLAYTSAVDALELFKARKASPVELLATLIDRIQSVNPRINCLADRYFDEALAKAKAAEQAYAGRGSAISQEGT